jgi:hypothetical protein
MNRPPAKTGAARLTGRANGPRSISGWTDFFTGETAK